MPKTVPITGTTGKWARGRQTGGWGREVMMAGTTQPGWSEDPWAQVGPSTSSFRTLRRSQPTIEAAPKDGVNRAC